MRKRKRQAVKKLIQCAAVIAAGVLAIILFMLAIWYRGSYLFTAGGAAIVRGGMDVQPFAAVIPRLYEMPEK